MSKIGKETLYTIVDDRLKDLFKDKQNPDDIKKLADRCKVLIDCIDYSKKADELRKELDNCRRLINIEIEMFINPKFNITIEEESK